MRGSGMEDFPPMRPVSVQPEGPSPAPLWKRGAVVLLVVVTVVASSSLRGGSPTASVIAGVLVIGGCGLFTASIFRELRENRTNLIRWWGRQEVQPHSTDLLSMLGSSLAGIGAVILTFDDSIPWPLPIVAVFAFMMLITASLYIPHNRRVRRLHNHF
ncbi:hypothetical protein QMK17_11510 [Rhodococcus sp. G-MC3]|uniref:hypothetical protein n=1 Tax=Rhodococcus sp. G-MC3 TaxID=3046209 RepID=UPI0024B9141D|nr:hypothetical protein [Rhodococcus sp. G-MC3]MDJ0393958.1 hypothetical protein [Rhodococcus sp. G-MC3]